MSVSLSGSWIVKKTSFHVTVDDNKSNFIAVEVEWTKVIVPHEYVDEKTQVSLQWKLDELI